MRNNATLLFLCLTLFAALVVFLAAWHVGLILSWSRSPLKLATSGPLDQYETHPALYHFNLVSYPDTNFTQRRQHEASTVADIVEVEPFYKSWNLSVVTLIEPEISRNCTALFKGDTAEVNKVLAENRNWPSTAYDQKFNKLYLESEGCEDIVSEFQGNFYVSEEESSFPLAFSMNVHDNAQQVIRLLKAIYRPHNAYCIHYDSKSDRSFKKVFDKLAKCLPNVIIPKKIINVVYECYPILEAQLSCMTDLLALRDRYPWNYTTTLCGKELPLRTNREIVHLLKQMKGLPALYSHPFDSNELSRKLFRMVIKNNICVHTRIKLDHRVPYGMELIKSMAYFSLTPEFTDYILNSPEAKALGEFLKPTKGPEEAFYGTLLHYWMNGKYTDSNAHLNYTEQLGNHNDGCGGIHYTKINKLNYGKNSPGQT